MSDANRTTDRMTLAQDLIDAIEGGASHSDVVQMLADFSAEPAAELERLRKIEAVARELITTGLRNNGEHLIVAEKHDKSDPHYRLCDLLEPKPLTKEAKL